jgi:ferredoxin
MSHGRCYSVASRLFDSDDEGRAVLLRAQVPTTDEQAARDAQAPRPAQSIGLQQ